MFIFSVKKQMYRPFINNVKGWLARHGIFKTQTTETKICVRACVCVCVCVLAEEKLHLLIHIIQVYKGKWGVGFPMGPGKNKLRGDGGRTRGAYGKTPAHIP